MPVKSKKKSKKKSIKKSKKKSIKKIQKKRGGMVEDEKEILPIQSVPVIQQDSKANELPQQDDYCINLLWLSNDCKLRPTDEEVEKISSQCLKWRKYNEDVYLWTNCMGKFQHLSKSDIMVMSVNSSNYVDVDTDIIIKSIIYDKRIFNYIRIDFFKNVIMYRQLLNYKYVIFTDIDINTYPEDKRLECEDTELEDEIKRSDDRFFTPDFLFNHDDTKKKLDTCGMVLACKTGSKGITRYENSFMMCANKPEVIKLIKTIFIDYLNIAIMEILDNKDERYFDYYQRGIIFKMYRTFYTLLSIALGRCSYKDTEIDLNKDNIFNDDGVLYGCFYVHDGIERDAIFPRYITNIIDDTYTTIQHYISPMYNTRILYLNIPTKRLIMPVTKN